jgi:hypothetical protein
LYGVTADISREDLKVRVFLSQSNRIFGAQRR